jgi:hypothetical protein
MMPFAEVNPAEAAFVTLLIATGLGSFSLLCTVGVLRTWRRRRQEEWLMRERLAWWRRGLGSAPGEVGPRP